MNPRVAQPPQPHDQRGGSAASAGSGQQREDVDAALLATLASPHTYPGRPGVALHETHASWVFVAGDRAYKVKKPVALGFLDYRTLAQRHASCREEVRVNRELARDIYLGVRSIVPAEGGFRLARDGTPGAVEYAVEMRRFDEADSFAGLIAAGSLTRAEVIALARLLARFHRRAPVVRDWRPERVLAMWQKNLRELKRAPHPAEWPIDDLAGFADAFVRAHAAEIAHRAKLGLARDGHGDLRCEHVLSGPTIRVVDRIEFDPALRRTDVACDLAFLTMDLEAHGQRWAANALLAAYRQAGLDPGGAALLSFYAAYRALVRTKVALLSVGDARGRTHSEAPTEASRLWSLAECLCWRARSPLAVVICGPAASGKSALAAELSRRSGMPIISSDVVRKQLAGLAAEERARPKHYRPEFTRRTYEALGREAVTALHRDGAVIVDATCRSHSERSLVLGPLWRAGACPILVRCEVPLELALERARHRMSDPHRTSDATPEIAREQFAGFEEINEDREGAVLRLDATQAIEKQLAAVQRGADRTLRARAVNRSPGGASQTPDPRAARSG
jgi:aminoglycoside phosphotransferase family enzyme/predicted kinase